MVCGTRHFIPKTAWSCGGSRRRSPSRLCSCQRNQLPDEPAAFAYATGDNNLVLSDGVYDYQYDSEGNRTRRTHITSGEVTEYDWDHRNRLSRVTIKDQ